MGTFSFLIRCVAEFLTQKTFNGDVEKVADFVVAPVTVEESAAPNERAVIAAE